MARTEASRAAVTCESGSLISLLRAGAGEGGLEGGGEGGVGEAAAE